MGPGCGSGLGSWLSWMLVWISCHAGKQEQFSVKEDEANGIGFARGKAATYAYQ